MTTTTLDFGPGKATKTLPLGGDYNISQGVYAFSPGDNVTLNFSIGTINNDTDMGAIIENAVAHQTLNFDILNLTGTLYSGYAATTTLNGDILNNNGTIDAVTSDTTTINTKLLGGSAAAKP